MVCRKEPARLAGWTTHDLHRVGDHAAEQMPVSERRRRHVVDDGSGKGGKGLDQRVCRLGRDRRRWSRAIAAVRPLAGLLGVMARTA